MIVECQQMSTAIQGGGFSARGVTDGPLGCESFVELLQVFLGPGRVAAQSPPPLVHSHGRFEDLEDRCVEALATSMTQALQALADLIGNSDGKLPAHGSMAP